jgi:hypothetical protein
MPLSEMIAALGRIHDQLRTNADTLASAQHIGYALCLLFDFREARSASLLATLAQVAGLEEDARAPLSRPGGAL